MKISTSLPQYLTTPPAQSNRAAGCRHRFLVVMPRHILDEAPRQKFSRASSLSSRASDAFARFTTYRVLVHSVRWDPRPWRRVRRNSVSGRQAASVRGVAPQSRRCPVGVGGRTYSCGPSLIPLYRRQMRPCVGAEIADVVRRVPGCRPVHDVRLPPAARRPSRHDHGGGHRSTSPRACPSRRRTAGPRWQPVFRVLRWRLLLVDVHAKPGFCRTSVPTPPRDRGDVCSAPRDVAA